MLGGSQRLRRRAPRSPRILFYLRSVLHRPIDTEISVDSVLASAHSVTRQNNLCCVTMLMSRSRAEVERVVPNALVEDYARGSALGTTRSTYGCGSVAPGFKMPRVEAAR